MNLSNELIEVAKCLNAGVNTEFRIFFDNVPKFKAMIKNGKVEGVRIIRLPTVDGLSVKNKNLDDLLHGDDFDVVDLIVSDWDEVFEIIENKAVNSKDEAFPVYMWFMDYELRPVNINMLGNKIDKGYVINFEGTAILKYDGYGFGGNKMKGSTSVDFKVRIESNDMVELRD